MSDNSIPTPPGGQQRTPPPAPPAAPYQSAPSAPQSPAYPVAPAPSYPAAAPTQSYPGAAPSFAPGQQPYGAAPAQQPYGAAVQPYGAAPQQYGAPAPGQPGAGYPTYAAPIYPPARPTSGLAVTSLICGIAGIVLFWALIPLLASIVAVITGHMALRQTKANPAIGGRGMAFAGLIMGYIMVGFLVITIVMTIISFVFFGAFTLPFIFSS
ncbi:DUF4190 domain-containing protein [Microbacterium sp. Leaf320]|uniref:DUF4190 domain-containing protein n=1 Tax=Microbacterium sp. Leaf320 TaxID=1736334 RepID=UPI0006F202AA|nr:DUF4190 domain-containing protein [Microbacterium sp. Leaf320]KQQ64704.1 hypothetical protein ASF63_17205 [Microbacterium sp. Leaf320]